MKQFEVLAELLKSKYAILISQAAMAVKNLVLSLLTPTVMVPVFLQSAYASPLSN
jgi:hypothetical protein